MTAILARSGLLIGGKGAVTDAFDEDAPLIFLEWFNEANDLSDEAKIRITDACAKALGKELYPE